MIKHTLLAFAVSLAVLMAGTPAVAHHSVNAEFDMSKLLTITGELVRLDEVNPHSWWYVDVKEKDGKVTAWKLESLGPNGLRQKGVSIKKDLKVGETYTFTIVPAWKPVPVGFMKSMIIKGTSYVMSDL